MADAENGGDGAMAAGGYFALAALALAVVALVVYQGLILVREDRARNDATGDASGDDPPDPDSGESPA